MKNEMYTFGQKLKRLLRIYDMQQDELAKLCGIQQGTVSTWINNRSENFYPKVEYLKIIANQFNVTIDDLVSNKPFKQMSERKLPIDGRDRPVWIETKIYVGFCLVDKKNRKFIGTDGFELSFGEAKLEKIKCRRLAPSSMYKIHGNGRPLRLEEIINLYAQSVIERRTKSIWVEALDNGNIKNNWLNGWYELREKYVNKGDTNFLYEDYGSHWIAYKE